MPAPKDGVHIRKYEDSASGGDDADQGPALEAPLEPWEDAPYVQGIFYQPPSAVPVSSSLFDKVVYTSRDNSGNMLLKDENNGEKTLAELANREPEGAAGGDLAGTYPNPSVPHIAETNNPHATDIANLGAGTLAELNSKVTDATLDTTGTPRPPNGVAGGDLAGSYPNPTVPHVNLSNNPHATDIGNLGAGTLAELNSKVTDATLDTSTAPRTPIAHAASHAPGGSDALTTATAVEITDSTNAEGGAASFARSNHQHAHGNRGGGTLHAAATPSVAGFQSAADKTKLDGIEAGAQLNTGANVGGGSEVFQGKTGSQFDFRTLVAGDSIALTQNADTIEIAAVIAQVFSADSDEATNSLSTNSTTAQNAGISVTAPVDGNYVVFFDAEVNVTNNNGTMAISLSTPNTTTEEPTSVRENGGNKQQTSITIETYTGLTAGDVITALYRKESGGGSASLGRRSLLLQRIG